MSEAFDYIEKDEIRGRVRDYQAFGYLLRFCRPYRTKFILALSLLTFSGAFTIISARVMGSIVEHGLAKRHWVACVNYALLILLMEALAILATWRGRKLLATAASESVLLIRKTIFKHIHLLPLSYYDRQPQGRIVTRITHDVEGLEEFLTGGMGRLVNSVIVFFMVLVAMLTTYWPLGLTLVLSMVPAGLLIFTTRHQIKRINREMSRNNSACNARLAEYLNGISVIRGLGLEQWSQKNYDHTVHTLLNSQLRANFLYAWSRPLTNFLCALPLMGLIGLGGQQVMAGTLGLGIFVAFVRFCERFSYPIIALTREIHVIQQAFTSAERITTFLNAQSEEDELGKNGAYAPIGLEGTLAFENVSMGYDKQKLVLKNISFQVNNGEKIGLVGTTGSGKTTTASLLARLYEFQEGNIVLSGRSLRDYDRYALREKIGFVSQDVVLFRGSLRENLACEANISDEKINQAIEQTGLSRVLKKNQLTLDSLILEGGANLSVGERQLVSLTRVLLREPSILILDEATANIDPEYEEIIHEAVYKVMEKRTCLIIAHRLETLKKCHRLLVFKDGQLVESGPFDQLIQNKGHFYQLHKYAQGPAQDSVEKINSDLSFFHLQTTHTTN